MHDDCQHHQRSKVLCKQNLQVSKYRLSSCSICKGPANNNLAITDMLMGACRHASFSHGPCMTQTHLHAVLAMSLTVQPFIMQGVGTGHVQPVDKDCIAQSLTLCSAGSL